MGYAAPHTSAHHSSLISCLLNNPRSLSTRRVRISTVTNVISCSTGLSAHGPCFSDSTDNVSAGNKLGERGRSVAAPGKATAFPRLGEHDFLVEDRFGELDRRDSVPAESRDLGHLGPIVREVGDKLKRAHLSCDLCALY